MLSSSGMSKEAGELMELLLGSLGFWFESVLLLSWTIVGWRENDPMSQRNPLRTPL